MKNSWLCLFVTVIVGSFISCSDKSSNSSGNQQVKASMCQVGGCQSHLAKASQIDSCFSYQFGEKLVVDFCLSGNCCPDSNRFVLSHEISGDTVYVAAVDTAEHLCKCICNYLIHSEFENMPLDHYVFFVTQVNDSNETVCYNCSVDRNIP